MDMYVQNKPYPIFSDINISSINAKMLDMFILLEDCNGALSLVVMG